jgi:hypothetical protein
MSVVSYGVKKCNNIKRSCMKRVLIRIFGSKGKQEQDRENCIEKGSIIFTLHEILLRGSN